MNVQLAKHLYKELDLKKPNCMDKDYAIFEKYDGWYGYMDFVDGKSIGIMSRAHRLIPSTLNLSKVIVGSLTTAPTGRLIFEITIPSIPDFSALNGVLNRSKGYCQAQGVVLKCHDFIANENALFSRRYDALETIVKSIKCDAVQLAPIIAIGSYRDAQALVKPIWERGGEGVILKQLDAPYYAGKRNSTLLKIKEDVDADLLVIAVEEGKGKYLGTTGSLMCKDKAGHVHSISGMTDEQRYQWWTNHGLIVGKVIEIKAMKKLKDGGYREPRFKAVRFDKTEKDID